MMKKASDSRRLLLSSEYPRLEEEARKVGSFIHYDVAARNFIIQDGKAYLIDFDYCARDLPLVDLMRLMKRSLKYGNNAENKLKSHHRRVWTDLSHVKRTMGGAPCFVAFSSKSIGVWLNDISRMTHTVIMTFFKRESVPRWQNWSGRINGLKFFRRYTGLEVAR